MLSNLLKISIAGICIAGILGGCSGHRSGRLEQEQARTDSLLAVYQDSMAVSPGKTIEAFSERRSLTKDSLCIYKLLSHESKCYYYLNRMEDAFRLSGQVVRFCKDNLESEGSRALLAEAYNNQGVFWQESGRRDSAIHTLGLAAGLLQTLPRREALVSIYINLADGHLQDGDFPLCGYYYRKALFTADSLGVGRQNQFAIYSGLAKLYLELENFPEADAYFRKAEQADSLCTPYERYFFSNTRGNYYYNTKEYETALGWFRKADRITDAFPQPLYKAIVRGNMGEIFILAQQPDSARFYLDDARRLFGQAYGQPAFRYYMDGLYASLALLEGDLPQAERLLSGLSGSQQVNPLYTYYNNRRQEELYRKKGDFRKAYAFKQEADCFNDSLRNVKVKNNLAEIDFRYRQDTLLLKKDMQLLDARSTAVRWKATAYFCVLLFLFSLLALFCRHLYKRKKQEERYRAQVVSVNRLRMAVVRNRLSPHFIFNALNIILPAFRQYEGLDKPIRLLIKVLRGNLLFSERMAVPLKDEIRLVEEYLQLRLLGDPDRIRIVWELPSEIPADWFVPAMFIQIPVENAVKYAFEPDDVDACILIRVSEAGAMLHIDIEDNGCGFMPDGMGGRDERSTGLGLDTLFQTVDILNSRNQNKMSFVIQDRSTLVPKGHGTLVSIGIPFDYTFDL